MNTRGLPVEAHLGVVVLRAELDVGDVLQPDDRVVLLANDELLELLDGVQVGVGREIDLHESALGAADRGEIVVRRKRRADLRRADVQRRHLSRFQPDAHRECARTENLAALHAGEGRQARLDHAHEVVGDFALRKSLGRKTQVRSRKLRIRRLHADGRNFGFRRQLVANLVYLRGDVGERLGWVVVELEARGDERKSEQAFRFDVVDAVRGGDRALDRAW